MNQKNNIILIAAIGKNNELGKKGKLIWDIPGDLRRFKEVTKGHPMIMGYKTYISIGNKPLPGRTNIVMALEEDVVGDVHVARSVDEAISIAQNSPGSDKIFIIGGGQIYDLFLSYADILDLTVVEESDVDADTYFPTFDRNDFDEISREDLEVNDLMFAHVVLKRK